jgi:hypothetical protein
MANHEKVKIELRKFKDVNEWRCAQTDPFKPAAKDLDYSKLTFIQELMARKKVSIRALASAVGYDEKSIRLALSSGEMGIELFVAVCIALGISHMNAYGDVDYFVNKVIMAVHLNKTF